MDGTTSTPQATRTVRVTGTLDERFVEFEFAVGDPDLAVELVLPFDAFRQFCERHAVRHLPPARVARADLARMERRFRAHGQETAR